MGFKVPAFLMDLAIQGSWMVDNLTCDPALILCVGETLSSLVLSSLRCSVLVQWEKYKGLGRK